MYGNPVRLHRCPECRTPHEGEGLCPACAAQWEGEVEAIVAAPEAGRREARDPGHYEPRFRNPPGDSIVFIHDRVRTADGRIEERKNSWINRWGRPSNTTLARVVSDYERANPGETILDAEVRKQSGVVVARYSHRHGNPVPPSHAVHGWAKLNRISREMTGRDYRDLPDDGPEQDAVMRAYERDEDAMAAEYGRHGNPAGQINDRRRDPSHQPRGFVVMRDKFMSGWGKAPGNSYYAIAVETENEGYVVIANAADRSEMKNVRWSRTLPRIRANDHLSVTDRHKAPRWFVPGAFKSDEE
jgi:hypothetical protein